jgi:hypothetical protein
MFNELRKEWSEAQIVKIVAAIAATGFVNRWNATMATPLEEEPMHVGRHIWLHPAGIPDRTRQTNNCVRDGSSWSAPPRRA